MFTVCSEFTTSHVAGMVAVRSVEMPRVHDYRVCHELTILGLGLEYRVYSEFTTSHVAGIVAVRSVEMPRVHNCCMCHEFTAQ